MLITAERLPEAQQVLDLLKDAEYFEFVRRDAQTAGTLQGRATMTPIEAEWAQRYQAIADQVTALGRERSALQAKSSRTEDEAQRLAALDDDLRIAARVSAVPGRLDDGLQWGGGWTRAPYLPA